MTCVVFWLILWNKRAFLRVHLCVLWVPFLSIRVIKMCGGLVQPPSCFLKVCDIQGNLQDGSQVVVSVIFENKCSSFLKSMEFNVLDSLNSKLQRPEGSGPHDGLTVPFQLPPGQSLHTQHSHFYISVVKTSSKLLILLINWICLS